MLLVSLMNQSRAFNLLVWNVRGINSQGKWDAIRDKIAESSVGGLLARNKERTV
jgi:hypothetical protein